MTRSAAAARFVSLGIAAVVTLSMAIPAAAQTGNQVKIIAVQLSVKHRVGPTGNFVTSTVGALLPPGSRIQTGARSKCGLRFPDGSVVKMGERSDLVIQSATDKATQLNSGRLWAKVIAGTTASVQGSRGVAVVKGTEWTFDGETICCFDGAVAYETDGGTTDVPAGYEGTAAPDGQVRVEPGPGRQYPGGDLIQWFGGMRTGVNSQVTGGDAPGTERKARDVTIDGQMAGAITPRQGNLNVFIQGGDSPAALTPGARARSAELSGVFRTPRGAFPGVDPSGLAPLWLSRVEGAAGPPLVINRLGQTQPEGLPDKRYFFGPYTRGDVFGYVGDGGSSFGLRLHPSVIWGPVYIEVGATTRVSTWHGDGTDITEAFAMLRQDWGAVTVGRQRFLEGPVNNSRLGSVMGFDTGDAVRVKADLGKLTVDAAYVHKMSPVLGPWSQGWYGRLQHPVGRGVGAFNLVSHEGEDDPGFSVDLAMPVVEGDLDLYGEWGRDAFDRELYTIGAYFPGLYQKESLDLFVEYAAREELPSVASARLYKEINEDTTIVLSLDKQSGQGGIDLGAGVIWRFGD